MLPVLLAGALVVALVQTVFATAPVVNFGFAESDPSPTTGCKSYTFTDATTDAESDVQLLEWDFGDGTADETGSSVTHTFATPGPKTVTLTATDADPGGDGDADGDGVDVVSSGRTFTVSSPAPTASIDSVTPSNQVEPGEDVTLEGSGFDADGTIAGLEWDVDGNTVFNPGGPTGPSVTVDFPTSGQKPIRLRVRDNCGQVSSNVAVQTIVVDDDAPNAVFSVTPPVALPGGPVTLTATASDPGGAIAGYHWDLNGNNQYEPTEPNGAALDEIQTSFLQPGTHFITLQVTDNSGKKTVAVNSVYVDAPPVAGFEFTPRPPLIGDLVTFRPTGSGDSDGTITTYEWDLDGNGSYERSAPTAAAQTQRYTTPGTRTVSLRVTDDRGAQDVLPLPVAVGSNMRPQASFRITPARPVEGEEVTFSSTAEDPDDRLTKNEWDLDNDGRFEAQGRVVSKTFNRGKRPVTLRVTDSRGATATSTEVVEVSARKQKNPPDVESSVSYVPKRWGIALVTFTVKVPGKTRVSVTCKGRGCPRGTFRKYAKKATRLRFRKLKGNLRAGAKIWIIFTRPGHITGWDTITVRGKKRRTVLREQCKLGAAKRPKACPSD